MVVVQRDERQMPVPPDGGWGWVVVFASFMIHVIADGVTYTFGIFYFEFLKHFGEGKGSTAWVASIMVGTTYCIGPVASGLTNKYGCRAVTVAGAVLAAFGLALSTIAPNVLFLYFSIGICTGAGFGLMYLPSIVSVTCYFERRRAFATGIAVCGSGMGTFALAPLTEYLVESYGWKGAMLIVAGLVLNCAVFGGLFRPLEFPPSRPASPARDRKKPNLPKLKVTTSNGRLSNGRLSMSEESPCTPLMFHANCRAIIKEKRPEDASSLSLSRSDLSPNVLPPGYSTNPSTPSEVKMNGFSKDQLNSLNRSKSDLSSNVLPPSPNILPPGYSANPTDVKLNGFSRDVALRSLDRKEGSSYRNSLMLPSELLKRKVEGSPLSSFVCSSASLAQTNKELSQLESSSSRHPSTGLLYRKDIFYSGSLGSDVDKFRSNPDISYSAVHRSESFGESSKDRRFRCCPREIRDALTEMTDLSLLSDPVFLMFAVSNFLTSVGFNVPYVYTKDRVSDMGIATDEGASYLLSVIGISNTVGRVTLGYLSDRACVNRLWIYNTSLIICGLSTALSCYAATYTLMATYCATFGATAGAYVSLTSVILVDLLGLDKLTNAFGILLVFEGVSCLLGPPITGWLYDGLGSYDPGFIVAGSMIAVSGLMLFLVPCLPKRKEIVCLPLEKNGKLAETEA